MKKLIIKKLSDNSIITQTQVADHDEFQWVIENKHSFGQDDVYEDKQVLVKEAWIEKDIPVQWDDEGNPTVFGEVNHEAIYETVKELIISKDWYVETIDLAPEMEAQVKVDEAKAEISKGINALAVFKVLVKEKGLTTLQIAELFSSPEINKIISALTTGSLPLASALVASYQADGVLVSESDKEAVINALR